MASTMEMAIFLMFFNVFLALAFVFPPERASKLFASQPTAEQPSLVMLFTGDTQYHYPCTDQNAQCKHWSRSCRLAKERQQALKSRGQTLNTIATTEDPFAGQDCIKMESEFANEVQRKCIFRLVRLLEQSGQKPSALVINGDLTNFGHAFQLDLFKAEWLRTMPLPILVGLGNHDYENNVNDCVGNNCAERMLRWFSQEYAPSMGQLVGHLDLSKRNVLWRTNYESSLAYASKLCASECVGENCGKIPFGPSFCIHSLQLQNRPDYAAQIEYPTGQWQIRGSFHWLTAQLGRIIDEAMASNNGTTSRQIVLLNLHNFSSKVAERLRTTLEQWNRLNSGRNVRLDFMVLFAHIHENHSVAYRCWMGRKVPHIFVGSVPNNRFTAIRFNPAAAESEGNAGIFLMSANANSTMEIVQILDFQWENC